ncbi:unnamed protein product [Urochloa humidicola]
MGDTAKLDPFSAEFWERRVTQLRSQKRKLVTAMTKVLTEQADSNGRKKRREEVKSLERKVRCPETRKKLVEQTGLENAEKRAREINSVERTIKFMQKRKKCIVLAAKRSISMEDAQKLVEQEEKLKDEKKKQKVKAKLVEQPAGEGAQEYERVQDLNAAINNLPTQTIRDKDPATVAAVNDPDDKMMLINVAKAIVNVSYPIEPKDLEDLDGCCTGLIVDWDMDNKTAKILTCDCFGRGVPNRPESNCKIFVRWQYKEDDGLIEAKLLFFSNFYHLSLLEVAFQGTLLDIPTQIPHFCLSPPKHGDEVFALGRDRDLSLAVRHGTIMPAKGFRPLRQGFLFAGYELPECGTGGPVVDHHGDVVGLTMPCIEGISAIFPISTALSCLKMWTQFRRIARPFLGMRFRNVEVLDGVCGDTSFDGLVVDEVGYNSDAWKNGIRNGNVIVSFDEKSPKPLPEFEGFLLSYGSEYLNQTYTEVDFKLEVQDAPNVKRNITLHVPFTDVANVQFSRLL